MFSTFAIVDPTQLKGSTQPMDNSEEHTTQERLHMVTAQELDKSLSSPADRIANDATADRYPVIRCYQGVAR